MVFVAVPALAKRPNVLLIMTDDQGWGDISSHGNPDIQTPAMDSIAVEGARFDRFFVSPVCAPTRGSLLTGRYCLRGGVHGVTRGYENLRSRELTLAEALKSAGYATGAFGKWHNGRHYPVHPNGQGFDEFFGFCGGHWQNYFDTHLEHNGERVESQGYITDVLTDAALKFIEKHAEREWLCYLPYNAPHSPWEVPDKYWDKYADRDLDDETRCAYAMVDCIDENIGRILKRLEELKLSDDTIVLFLTDNGPNGNRYNGDMRGRKGSVHEGGIRVPLFVRWPGKIKAGIVVKPIAAHIDILPTVLEMCEVQKPAGPPLDGKSLWPLLQGKTAGWPERMIFTDRTGNDWPGVYNGSVRTDRWRAVFERKSWALYDMVADPGERKDVQEQFPLEFARLKQAYETWLADTTQEGLDYIPIPIGHPQRPTTELPGNEAFMVPEVEAGISYIKPQGYANAWITHWTDTEAYPKWIVDVMTPGSYEVTLKYKTKAENVGSLLRVELGEAHTEGTITEVHDPAPIPSPDRVEESPHYQEFVWREVSLGRMRLAVGKGELKVRAITKPGSEVVDLKAVRLTPVK